MKTILILLLLAAPLFASDLRTFTDEETKRTLKAVLVGKSPTGDRVTLRLESGRVVSVETKRLIETDQTYVKLWMNPQDQLTCRADGKPFDGYKYVTVNASAGPGDVVLEIEPGTYNRQTHEIVPFEKSLKAGEDFNQRFILPNKYTVTLSSESGVVIDKESHSKKTGMK